MSRWPMYSLASETAEAAWRVRAGPIWTPSPGTQPGKSWGSFILEGAAGKREPSVPPPAAGAVAGVRGDRHGRAAGHYVAGGGIARLFGLVSAQEEAVHSPQPESENISSAPETTPASETEADTTEQVFPQLDDEIAEALHIPQPQAQQLRPTVQQDVDGQSDSSDDMAVTVVQTLGEPFTLCNQATSGSAGGGGVDGGPGLPQDQPLPGPGTHQLRDNAADARARRARPDLPSDPPFL